MKDHPYALPAHLDSFLLAVNLIALRVKLEHGVQVAQHYALAVHLVLTLIKLVLPLSLLV